MRPSAFPSRWTFSLLVVAILLGPAMAAPAMAAGGAPTVEERVARVVRAFYEREFRGGFGLERDAQIDRAVAFTTIDVMRVLGDGFGAFGVDVTAAPPALVERTVERVLDDAAVLFDLCAAPVLDDPAGAPALAQDEGRKFVERVGTRSTYADASCLMSLTVLVEARAGQTQSGVATTFNAAFEEPAEAVKILRGQFLRMIDSSYDWRMMVYSIPELVKRNLELYAPTFVSDQLRDVCAHPAPVLDDPRGAPAPVFCLDVDDGTADSASPSEPWCNSRNGWTISRYDDGTLNTSSKTTRAQREAVQNTPILGATGAFLPTAKFRKGDPSLHCELEVECGQIATYAFVILGQTQSPEYSGVTHEVAVDTYHSHELATATVLDTVGGSADYVREPAEFNVVCEGIVRDPQVKITRTGGSITFTEDPHDVRISPKHWYRFAVEDASTRAAHIALSFGLGALRLPLPTSWIVKGIASAGLGAFMKAWSSDYNFAYDAESFRMSFISSTWNEYDWPMLAGYAFSQGLRLVGSQPASVAVDMVADVTFDVYVEQTAVRQEPIHHFWGYEWNRPSEMTIEYN